MRRTNHNLKHTYHNKLFSPSSNKVSGGLTEEEEEENDNKESRRNANIIHSPPGQHCFVPAFQLSRNWEESRPNSASHLTPIQKSKDRFPGFVSIPPSRRSTPISRPLTSPFLPNPNITNLLMEENEGEWEDEADFNIQFGEEEEEKLCNSCEANRLVLVLQELHGIEEGYKELLDKLKRNHTGLKIRSETQHSLLSQLKVEEVVGLEQMSRLNRRFVRVRKALVRLKKEEQQKQRSITPNLENLMEEAKNKRNSNGQLPSSISRPKMTRIISQLKSDLDKRRKRMEILEECFGTRTIESETKAQLGYLPSSIRYFPDKRNLHFQFFDDEDPIDEKFPTSPNIDSNELLATIISGGRRQILSPIQEVASKSILKPNLEIESLYQPTPTKSSSDSNFEGEMGLLSSTRGDTPIPPRVNLQDEIKKASFIYVNPKSARIPKVDSSGFVLSENNSSRQMQNDLKTPEWYELNDGGSGTTVTATTTPNSTATVTATSSEVLVSSSLVGLMNSPRSDSEPALKNASSLPANLSMKSIVGTTKEMTINNLKALPKNIKIPERIAQLAQSIIDINRNIALQEEANAKLARAKLLEAMVVVPPLPEFVEMVVETKTKFKNHKKPPKVFKPISTYFLRSSMSSSSLDDPRDYSVLDFPAQGARPELRIKLTKQIDYDDDDDEEDDDDDDDEDFDNASTISVLQKTKSRKPIPKSSNKKTYTKIQQKKLEKYVPQSLVSKVERKLTTPKFALSIKPSKKSPPAKLKIAKKIHSPKKKARVIIATPKICPRSSKANQNKPVLDVKIGPISRKPSDTKPAKSKPNPPPIMFPLVSLIDMVGDKDTTVKRPAAARIDIEKAFTINQSEKAEKSNASLIFQYRQQKSLAMALKSRAVSGLKRLSNRSLLPPIPPPISFAPSVKKVPQKPIIVIPNAMNNSYRGSLLLNPSLISKRVAAAVPPPPKLAANYLKPVDRSQKGITSTRPVKPIPVKEMPSYLRFGKFNALKVRNEQRKKGNEDPKVNVLNLLFPKGQVKGAVNPQKTEFIKKIGFHSKK